MNKIQDFEVLEKYLGLEAVYTNKGKTYYSKLGQVSLNKVSYSHLPFKKFKLFLDYSVNPSNEMRKNLHKLESDFGYEEQVYPSNSSPFTKKGYVLKKQDFNISVLYDQLASNMNSAPFNVRFVVKSNHNAIDSLVKELSNLNNFLSR
jgi:hypothetical protein